MQERQGGRRGRKGREFDAVNASILAPLRGAERDSFLAGLKALGMDDPRDGKSLREIEGAYAVSKSSLSRHKTRCLDLGTVRVRK